MMNVKFFAFPIPLVLATATAWAHDIITTKLTYTRDISRIFARRCVACHGDTSSIPLTSYEQVRPWAVDIKEQVLSRAMPPWGAVKGFGDLAPDHALTQEEIMIIAGWVVGGAPEGDRAMLPKELPVPGPPSLHLKQAVVVTNRIALTQPLEIVGIQPIATGTIASARITALLPPGRTQPLLWLYRYDGKERRVFTFRSPVSLAAGSVIESDAPLQFVLETSAAPSTTSELKR